MPIMAQWLDKIWEISGERIAALESISSSVKLKTENNEDKEGAPATNVQGTELQSLTLDFLLGSAAGVDVRTEFESWKTLLGQFGPFFLAGEQFGPTKMQLTEVSLGEGVLDNIGRIIQGRIGITLTEYAPESAGQKSTNTAKTDGSAANIGASAEDKATMKRSG